MQLMHSICQAACMHADGTGHAQSKQCLQNLIHESRSMVLVDLWACTGVGCRRRCRLVTGGLPCAIATTYRQLRSLRCPSSCPTCPGSHFHPPLLS